MDVEAIKGNKTVKYSTLSQANKAIGKIKDKIHKLKASIYEEEAKLADVEEQVKALEEKEIVAVLRKYEITLPQLKEFINGGNLPNDVTYSEFKASPELQDEIKNNSRINENNIIKNDVIENREVERIA